MCRVIIEYQYQLIDNKFFPGFIPVIFSTTSISPNITYGFSTHKVGVNSLYPESGTLCCEKFD